jgi:hypothetical protein
LAADPGVGHRGIEDIGDPANQQPVRHIDYRQI